MPIFFQGLEDRLPPFVQLGKLGYPISDGCDGHFVQAAGDLFPVSGDKWNRSVLIQKGRRGLNL